MNASFATGSERHAALSLPDRLLLSAEIRQREAEKDVTLWRLGRRAKLLLEGLPRLLGVGVHVCRIALQGAGLSEAEAPGASVVVERARRQPQQKLSLLVVEDPDEIPVVRHVGHERGRLDFLARPEQRPAHRQGPPRRETSWPCPRSARGWRARARGPGRRLPAPRDSAASTESDFAEPPTWSGPIGDRGAPPAGSARPPHPSARGPARQAPIPLRRVRFPGATRSPFSYCSRARLQSRVTSRS